MTDLAKARALVARLLAIVAPPKARSCTWPPRCMGKAARGQCTCRDVVLPDDRAAAVREARAFLREVDA